jgi:hypothetical protein
MIGSATVGYSKNLLVIPSQRISFPTRNVMEKSFGSKKML